MLNNNRGGYNLNYDVGFQHEAENYEKFKPYIKKVLKATEIELIARSILDKKAGIDLTAVIEDKVYGISLRVRDADYKSFTLTRHINFQYSEINKWMKKRFKTLKPAYHIQISKISDYEFRILRINIDAFSEYLEKLVKDKKLESFYKKELMAYEFKTKELMDSGFDSFFEEVWKY